MVAWRILVEASRRFTARFCLALLSFHVLYDIAKSTWPQNSPARFPFSKSRTVAECTLLDHG